MFTIIRTRAIKGVILGVIFCTSLGCSAQSLSVMTYNIRLDHAGDGDNQWELRKDRLVNQIRFYAPDIFGIQEGLPQQVHFIDDQLANFTFVGVGREDGKEKGEFSALYYDTDKFKLVVGSTFWLSDTPEVPSVGWDAALPRVCTYGLFENTKGKRFWVFNTHFDHLGENARVESMKLILKKINELNSKNLPVIFMGDLNVEPFEAPISEMTKQLKDTKAISKLSFGPEATFNGFDFGTTPTRRIDYIAVNDWFEVLKYAVLTDSYNQKYLSDHFAVFCVLKMN